MRVRKITLAVAVAALALPAAVASASSAALAGGVIPQVPTVDAGGAVPPPCMTALKIVCVAVASSHTGNFTGTYHPTKGFINDTSLDGGTCEDGNSKGPDECQFKFKTGTPSVVCNSNTKTAWSDYWNYRPVASQANDIGGNALYAEGGGIVDFNGTYFDADGVALLVHVHIHIAGLCGNEDTAQGLADQVTANSGLGTLDLSKTYKFDGYINITPSA